MIPETIESAREKALKRRQREMKLGGGTGLIPGGFEAGLDTVGGLLIDRSGRGKRSVGGGKEEEEGEGEEEEGEEEGEEVDEYEREWELLALAKAEWTERESGGRPVG